MGRQTVLLVLALLVVCSGCLSPLADSTASTNESEAETDEPRTETSEQTETEPSNPWGKETLTVSVEHSDGWHNVTGLVAETLEYWERNDEKYGTYEISYELEPNATDPDIRVRYVEDIGACGSTNTDGGAGFASRISAANPPEPPEEICIRRGYNEASTEHILKHEFGHLLGISHGEPPVELMTTDYEYLPAPRPDPSVRSSLPLESPVRVYVDRSAIHARRDYVAQRQLEETFAYYEGETERTVEQPVTITRVAEPENADIVLTFDRQSACNRNRVGSCAVVETNADDQPQYRISITTTHEETYGWHAGLWLAVALGANSNHDLPAPFRNASVPDRHAEWWTDN